MKKIILAITAIVIMVIMAGIYKFNFTNDDLYVELEGGKMVNIDDAAGAKLSEQMIATIHKKDFESDYLTKKESGAKLIDIRTQAEYDAGHYEGASMIDFYKSDFKSNLAKLDKATPYYIYCRSGNRSGQALQIMRGLGFKEVYDLAGGISMASDILKIVK